jgi:hypothetical protein
MAIAGRHTVDITTAALAIFTYDQMDQVRAELNGVSKQTIYATRADMLLAQVISQVAVSQKFVSEIPVSASAFY